MDIVPQHACHDPAHVLAALDAHGGNQARTAAALGIGTATLYRKLKNWATSAPG
jgi:transcriptional regulator of acetoin/glycerol metabolism